MADLSSLDNIAEVVRTLERRIDENRRRTPQIVGGHISRTGSVFNTTTSDLQVTFDTTVFAPTGITQNGGFEFVVLDGGVYHMSGAARVSSAVALYLTLAPTGWGSGSGANTAYFSNSVPGSVTRCGVSGSRYLSAGQTVGLFAWTSAASSLTISDQQAATLSVFKVAG